MKKNLLILTVFLFLLLQACNKEKRELEPIAKPAPSQTKNVAITDPNDINLNINWDWYNPNITTATLYFGQKIENHPLQGIQVSLPWFTFGNPINNGDKDYRPELGWTLYLRDFGTPDRPVQTPFFALYNKYSGVLRFFIYNYRTQNMGEASKTYYVGELGFNNPTSTTSDLLGFFAPMEQSMSGKVDPNLKQIVVTKKSSSDIWINLDFTLEYTGDQHGSVGPELLLNVYGSNETDLSLGTDFNTLSAKSSVGVSGNSTSSFSNFLNKAYEYTSSGSSFFESIDKLGSKIDNSSPKSSQVAATSQKYSNQNNQMGSQSIIGTIAAGIGVVKGAVGLVKSFFGGTKSATNTQTTLQYSGIVNTSGTALITNNLYSVQFVAASNAPLSGQHYVPIYKKEVGILAFSKPFDLILEDIAYYDCVNGIGGDDGEGTVKFYLKTDAYRFDPTTSAFLYGSNANFLRLDSLNVTILNNRYIEDLPSVTNLYNTFIFLNGTAEELNNSRTTIYSKNSGWKNVYPNPKVHDKDNDFTFTTLHYRDARASHGFFATAKNPDPSLRFPKVGIEIKYTITDPNYPNEESRERVIYKVIAPKVIVESTWKPGCPIIPSDS